MNGSLTSLQLPLRLGGNLCLDFANTAAYRDTERHKNYFPSYAYLLAWCWHENLINHEGVARLQQIATAYPSAAEAALASALRLREAIFGVFSAYIDGVTPSSEHSDCFQGALGTALSHRRLALESGKAAWTWSGEADDLTGILWPVVLSASELLTSDQMPRVKRCPNCGWLFLDTSRNGMRRWCSMEDCGSEAKS